MNVEMFSNRNRLDEERAMDDVNNNNSMSRFMMMPNVECNHNVAYNDYGTERPTNPTLGRVDASLYSFNGLKTENTATKKCTEKLKERDTVTTQPNTSTVNNDDDKIDISASSNDSIDDVEIIDVVKASPVPTHHISSSDSQNLSLKTNWQHDNTHSNRPLLRSPMSHDQEAQNYAFTASSLSDPIIPHTPARPLVYERVHCNITPGYIPTWGSLLRKSVTPTPSKEIHAYSLSLLSQHEFTIAAKSHYSNSRSFEPNLNGMRIHIKKIAKTYGNGRKAVFEKLINKDGTEHGRWRIPIGAYYAFQTFLLSDERNLVEGIPEHQLKIASLGRAVAERSCPSLKDLMNHGVPPVLAKALAPYQREGVDFVLQKKGRALIADDMGLGKTVQSIASMACYISEWPLLVLTPSSARFHWETELLHWLGEDKFVDIDRSTASQRVNNKKLDDATQEYIEANKGSTNRKRRCLMELDSHRDTKTPHIHPENYMKPLTQSQINVVSSSKDTIFPRKDTRVVICSYRLATNMIQSGVIFPDSFRCIIVDESHMLKSKNSKRTKTVLPLLKAASRVIMLSGTPAMAKPLELYPQLFALLEHMWISEDEYIRKYGKFNGNENENEGEDLANSNLAELHTMLTSTVMIRRTKAEVLKNLPGKARESVLIKILDIPLKNDIVENMSMLHESSGILGQLSRLHRTNETSATILTQENIEDATTLSPKPTVDESHVTPNVVSTNKKQISRKSILSEVFSMTGRAKIPAVVDMLDKFLDDPTNGKLCIFAHHKHVINSIVNHARSAGHNFMYIMGSTLPQARQENIVRFQTDPKLRLAILGITAAGVGVTLTAASTMWFAELFWTPAILIQAEDR